MPYSLTTESDNECPGDHVQAEDASIQRADQASIHLQQTRDASTQMTNEDYILLKQVRDASTRMTNKDIILLKQVRDASTQMTNEDLILLKQVRDASTQTTDKEFTSQEKTTRDTGVQISKRNLSVLEKTNLKGNNSTVKSKKQSSKKNRKRDMSSNKLLTHEKCPQKRSRPEISSLKQNVSLNLEERGCVNKDSRLSTSGTKNLIELDKSQATGNFPEFRNIEKSHFQNQGGQVHDNLILTKMSTPGQNNAPNKNISRNENSPAKVSEKEGLKRKIGFSIDDILAVPGTSRLQENVPQSNLSPEDLQNRLIQQSVEEMKKTPMCSICNKNISEHEEILKEKKILRCCQCRYSCNKVDFLLRHFCMVHIPEPFFCNICNVRFAEAGSHESEHKCDVCKREFQCITRLEDHYSVHEKYHDTFCRVCKDDIYNHGNKRKGRIVYKCCRKCPKEYDRKWKLQNHLYTHTTLRLFKCDYCEKRFIQKNNKRAHSKIHPKCEMCEKTFTDRNALDAHRLKEHK
ncbi:unnamed protein product [Larinioides sclopetarius]|uniref:C2H2-type domain-containing protein n=1 Tax=Larinioides sclopetarius TaxID=280406 RepID=A0AAV2A051_9ARAC